MTRKKNSTSKLYVLFEKTICGLLLTLFVLSHFSAAAQNNPAAKVDSTKKTTDSVLVKLKKARVALTKINTADKKIDGAKKVRLDLAEEKKHISPIKEDLKVSKKIEPKTLAGYNIILKRSQERLGQWRKSLTRSSADLKKSADELTQLAKDSALKIKAGDTSVKKPYKDQLVVITSKLKTANESITTRLDTVNKLLADVSATYLDVADVQTDLNDKLKTPAKSNFTQESPYLWSAPKEVDTRNITANLSTTYEGQNKTLGDFFSNNWDDRVLLLILGAAFFLWVYFNFKKAKQPDLQKELGELNFEHIRPIPVVASLIVLFNLAPLFEADAPVSYIELIEFMLMVALTLFFWKRLPKNELGYWLGIVVLYLIIVITTAAVHNAILVRLWLIFLNLGSAFIAMVFYKKLLKAEVAERFIKPVSIIYFVLNLLAIVANVFGRISLAKLFTITAITGIIQVIGLAAFIQIFTDALELQIKISSCNNGLFSRIDVNKTRLSFKNILSVIAVILWLLVFIINLNIAQNVFDFIYKLMNTKRVFGSISFTLGNVLFFSVILYVSNLFQKHIGVLFGEKSVSFANEVEHKSSKLTLFRLVIAIVGILIAITVSGIPMDKLTVVLGALSVGIGLGMQNIVNNFVSGIILIFEKPFQIGDFVELADKKGKIQDIGIRASKMLTQQGSEVIIPNGDLISNRFTNWTINAAYVRSEVLFKVNMAADINQVYKIVQEVIAGSNDIVKNSPPDILINSIAADTVELRILIWITNIYAEPGFKSRLFTELIARFNQAQIKIM